MIPADHHEHRESEEESFDWFRSYKDVADTLRALIPNKNARILMLGCGNSKLSEEVRRLLYTPLPHPQIVYIRCMTMGISILSTPMCVSRASWANDDVLI